MEEIKEEDLKALVPLNNEASDITEKAIKGDDLELVKNMFNNYQIKKNIVRNIKFDGLLDKVQEEMVRRFENRPGEFSNQDLLSYLKEVQSAVEKSNKCLSTIEDLTPVINLNQVNIESKEEVLSKESRERVTDAVKSILARLSKEEQEPIVIDAEEVDDDKGSE